MKTILQIAAIVVGLTTGGTAMAQDAAPGVVAAQAEPAQATTATEDWNPFSRSGLKVYMANVNGFVTTGDVVSVSVAKVPLDGGPGDYSYALDQIEMRCSAKQSRLVYSVEYGPNGLQTDRFDDPEAWAAYAPDTRDAYLGQLVCDGDRATPSYPSIKAFVDAGRH